MNISKRLLVTTVSMALFIGLAACNKEHTEEKTGKATDPMTGMVGDKMEQASGTPGAQHNMVSESIDNRAINANVKTAILADTDLRVLRISVETANGVTTLSGSVDSQQHSDKAGEVASAVDGVKEVENLLVVKTTD